jgi:hypothetical protein
MSLAAAEVVGDSPESTLSSSAGNSLTIRRSNSAPEVGRQDGIEWQTWPADSREHTANYELPLAAWSAADYLFFITPELPRFQSFDVL